MLNRLGPLHQRSFRRASAVGAGLALAAGLAVATAPIASASAPTSAVVFAQLERYYSQSCLAAHANAVVEPCPQALPGNPAPANEAWVFPLSSASGYVKIRDEKGNCLGVKNSSKAQGAAVIRTSCANTPNREWKPVLVKIAYQIYIYELKNRHSGRCLTDAGGNTTAGHKVVQSTCNKTHKMDWYRHATDLGNTKITGLFRVPS